ncbi:MAG: hypothetical protein ABIH23_23275 [bacterium]
MERRAILLPILACALGVQSQSIADSIPRQKMPEKVYEILREAVESFPYSERGQLNDYLKRSLEGLDNLHGFPWPDLNKLERVHVYGSKKEEEFFSAWRLPSEGEDLILVLWDCVETHVRKDAYSRVEVVEYSDELDRLLKFVKTRILADRGKTDFDFMREMGAAGLVYSYGVFPINHIYAAAYFGREDDAKILALEALRESEIVFSTAYPSLAGEAYGGCMAMLKEGAPWGEIVARCESSLALYADTHYGTEITNLLEDAKKHVAEEQFGRQATDDPEELPLDERIAYYIERFTEISGERGMMGECIAVGEGEGTRYSAAIVKIGPPTIPALIEHLTDRRTTRSLSGRHMRHQDRVLVQDVALQCIEKILDIRFCDLIDPHTYLLSAKTPEVREKMISDIKCWWKEYGRKPPIEGYVARLDKSPIPYRLSLLRQIERIDESAVDSVALLKDWADEAHPWVLPSVAFALARHGDLSLLPDIREMARNTADDDYHFYSRDCMSFLLRYGEPEDFRFIHRAVKREIRSGSTARRGGYYEAVRIAIRDPISLLAVPMLVDFLDSREPLRGIRPGAPFSVADDCMEALVRLTGHNEGYEAVLFGKENQSMEKRYAAIDRWIAWWKAEGEEAYCRERPEVLEVLGKADIEREK